MVFRRRDRRPWWKVIAGFLWPKGGWGRAFTYVRHRLNRLPDPPDRIARGIFAGVFTTFTPFYGFHFIVAGTLAWILRGNIPAALLGTFFGNPLTYVPIGVVSLQTGHAMLGRSTLGEDEISRSLGGKFLDAGDDLKNNFLSIFMDHQADWSGLKLFYDEVFFPYMIGGIVPGIVTALAAYYISLPVITAYQHRRKGVLKAKWVAMKEKKAAKEKQAHKADEAGKPD
ncbi:MAG: DUF2062 domain-containing protein [Roseovarius sp.]|uniref:DUF2062 domain-containing protein n=1 Tax=Roseovarius sp. TaxID=1486281 RepID=UPI001B4C837B|nr:DUF2062 domain-containing protein [Roseovarius sp.]MBQ0749740.1 DUF2062 domain-containing protein [Roseovarius sp.]MBQ0809446.1 DUF2062 domain-containing protein [Roseovarius sp.]